MDLRMDRQKERINELIICITMTDFPLFINI